MSDTQDEAETKTNIGTYLALVGFGIISLWGMDQYLRRDITSTPDSDLPTITPTSHSSGGSGFSGWVARTFNGSSDTRPEPMMGSEG